MLHTYVADHGGVIGGEDAVALRGFFERRKGEVFGLGEAEFEELSEAVKA